MIVVAAGVVLCSYILIAWKVAAYVNARVGKGPRNSGGANLVGRAPHWRLFSRTMSPRMLCLLLVCEDPDRSEITMEEISTPMFRLSSALLNPRRRYYATLTRSCRALLADYRRPFLGASARNLHVAVVLRAVEERLSRPHSPITEGRHVDVFIAVRDAQDFSAAPSALMKVTRI